MLCEFFLQLRSGGVPASIKEFLTLIGALEKQVIFGSLDDFYYLARICLVKDEKYFDRYDRVFAAYYKGIIEADGAVAVIPESWLKRLAEKMLTEEEKKLIESPGGWDKLMETQAHLRELRREGRRMRPVLLAALNGLVGNEPGVAATADT